MKTNTEASGHYPSRTRHAAAVLAAVLMAALIPTSRAQVAPVVLDIVSDTSWSCTDSAPNGWQNPGFDDSAWVDAIELPLVPLGSYNPGTTVGYPYPATGYIPGTLARHIWTASLEPTAYFRKSFNIAGPPLNSQAIVRVDDAYDFYVNGILVGSKHQRQPSGAQTYDISAHLREGENSFAVKGWDIIGGMALLFDADVRHVPNTPPVASVYSFPSTSGLDFYFLETGTTVRLNGSRTTDDHTPLQELGCVWSIESVPTGSTAALTEADTLYPILVPDRAGDYTIQLTVTDAGGAQGIAQITLTAVDVVTNGSFEEGLTGWNATGNLKIQSSPAYLPTHGTRLVSFNSGNTTPNGVLSCVLPHHDLNPLMRYPYQLDFDVGVLAYSNDQQRLEVTIERGPTSMLPLARNLVSDTIALTGQGGGKTVWVPKSYRFYSDDNSGTSTITLRFKDLSLPTNGIDLLLDNVRVSPAMEPLLVTSTPSSNAYIIAPIDFFEKGSWGTPFDKWYVRGQEVNLTAQAELDGNGFLNWLQDGAFLSSEPGVRVTMDGPHHVTAVYAGGPPFITAQPIAAEAVLGGTAVFNVTASGATPLTYQWRFNGTDIPGATTTELVIDPVEAGDAGTYDVVVSNSLNSVTSDPAVLTIQSAFAGLENGSFERDFEGWTVSGNVWVQTPTAFPATDGIKIAAFNAGNTPPNASLFQVFTTTPGQTYFLSFDMGVFSYNTFPQTLEVEVTGSPALLSRSFTMKGAGGGRCVWKTHDLSFTADSTRTTLTFRDRSKDTVALDLLLDNIEIVPSLMRSLTVASTGWLPAYGIPVTVSPADDNGEANGTTQFIRSYVDGTSVNLTVPQTYYTFYAPWVMMTYVFQKWQKDGVEFGTNPSISMTMDGDHTMTAAYVAAPPVITVQPQSITAGPGRTAVFTVGILEDTAAVRYQWRFNGTDISGATLSSLTIGPVEAGDAGRYDVVVTNPGGSATSREAVLTVVTGFMANGSFESNFDGWTGSGNVRIQTSPTPSDGARLVAFNAGNSLQNGWISQTFATTPGLSYLLSFDMGVLAYNTNEQRLQVELTGNTTIASELFSMRGLGGGYTLWETKSLPFIADSTATSVTFRDVSPATIAIDLLLDDVQVEEVPTEFSLIPAGSFAMGDSFLESGIPVYAVFVSPFYMARHEVTKALWDEVWTWGANHGYTDLRTGGGKAMDHPVQSITWHDMVKWCNARSEMDGLTPCYTLSGVVYRTGNSGPGAPAPACNWNANGYRLPTEAEWEKAARGGLIGKRFPWGDTISHGEANYYSSSDFSYDVSPTRGRHPTFEDGILPYTSPVGAFAANGYGLYHMAGNADEWCWDWYSDSNYGPGSDPRGPESGSSRVIRGGGWDTHADYCRVALRSGGVAFYSGDNLGFRVARSSVP